MLEVPFLLIRAALPGSWARGSGRIINVSLVHGIRASASKAPAYVSAKHGLEGLPKVNALERRRRVTSNCVAPGYVRTPLRKSSSWTGGG
jgi:3-hydroxybutyrate dehydrogenase